MDKLKEYFHTDWNAMTVQDWIGLGVTVVVFVAMVVIFIYIFHPANREKLEKHRDIPVDEDRKNQEDSR